MASEIKEIKIAHPFEEVKYNLAFEEESENYAKIVVEPLERGFGLTLGNALRRVLLTSLPGTAVHALEIEGAVHEFTALDGIEEDVVQIILNLKDLVLKSDSIGEQSYECHIDVTGPKVLYAGDLPLPTGVEVCNKDLVICHVAPNGKLNMTLYIRNGRGFASSEENKKFTNGFIGRISTDTNYSPIVRVNYKVETTRVGHDPNYDKLVLEVWTNGSITPKDSVSLASTILMEHLEGFRNLTSRFDELDFVKDPEVKKEETIENITIDDLDLTVRSYNCLKRAGILSVYDLTQKTEAEMMKVRNLGRKSLLEVKSKLTEKGLSFKDSKED